jgi:hypothetical protein
LADQVGIISGLGLLVVWLVEDVVAGEAHASGIVAGVRSGVKVVNPSVVTAAVDSRHVEISVAVSSLEVNLPNDEWVIIATLSRSSSVELTLQLAQVLLMWNIIIPVHPIQLEG